MINIGKYLIKIVRWSPVRCIIYHYYCWRTKNVDYFDLKALTTTFPIYAKHNNNAEEGNLCYGNYNVLKEKFKEKFHAKCMIEHGLYFKHTIVDECLQKGLDTIYTYSEYRKKYIINDCGDKLDKQIIPVGPYIQYAHNFKSKEQLSKLKTKFGKILLVFPSHNFPGMEVSYDYEKFMNKIEMISKDFDTVFVSMVGYDLKLGINKIYERKGYRVVTSGSRSDPNFLYRQRDLIELADMTMSNAIGTHIGYCICLGKPHFLFKQDQEWNDIENLYIRLGNVTVDELYDTFNSESLTITDKQIAVIKKYWGEFDTSKLNLVK